MINHNRIRNKTIEEGAVILNGLLATVNEKQLAAIIEFIDYRSDISEIYNGLYRFTDNEKLDSTENARLTIELEYYSDLLNYLDSLSGLGGISE